MRFNIQLDYSRDNLLSEIGLTTLKERYLLPGDEKSPQEAFARAACAFADDEAHAQRLYDYASKHWFMFATPVLSNGGTDRGLPISCFLNYVDDSVEGLVENQSEDAYLSRFGGGIGTDFSAVRSIGESTSTGNRTTGVVPFIKVIDSTMMAYQQGANRRGSAAIYLDISHPEIEEFLDIRKATGDTQRRSRYIHNAVNITDEFMVALNEDKENWPLIDPHSKKVKKVVKAQDLWKKILANRMATGEPYLHFTDTSNRSLPMSLQLKGLRINGSNLCNEIYLPTNKDRTAVCCLSSVNVEKFDEWKQEPLFIEDLIRMLDNVLQNFIDKAPKVLWRAINSAEKERSLGLGAMGYCGYLQSKGIPFESAIALGINKQIFAKIYHEAKAASGKLAYERGEPEDMQGTGYRNAHVIAIAPNASSSYICGNATPGIEPTVGNIFRAETMSGATFIKNKNLEKVLDKHGQNNDTVWEQIAVDAGSVKNLKFLSEQEKDLFKTAFELDQRWIVEHAGIRQPYIDQGQSVNLFFEPSIDPNILHRVHYLAWKKGLKGLYYCRSKEVEKAKIITGGNSSKKEDMVEEKPVVNQPVNLLNNVLTVDEGCLACQG